MFRLGFPEGARGSHLRHHLAGPQTRSVHVGDRVFGDALLLVAGIENRRAVARAQIVSLPVARRGIVNLEEEFQNAPIADFGGIENDFDRFGVGAVIAIGGVGHVAARIADARRHDAVVAAKEILHAPEAAAGENGPFGCHEMSSTWFRYSAYPSASIRSRGTKRSDAELMQ